MSRIRRGYEDCRMEEADMEDGRGRIGLEERGKEFERFERGYIMGPYFAVTSRYLTDKERHPVKDLRGFSRL